MTIPVESGWKLVKRFLPSAMAAGLMYGAIYQIIETVRYPLVSLAIDAINAFIRKNMANTTELANYGFMPVAFVLKQIAVAVVVLYVGIFIGLWVNLHAKHAPGK